MKNLLFAFLFLFTFMVVNAESGEKLSKVSNQKITKLELPNLEAKIVYEGGDTLFLDVLTENDEPVQIKLLGGTTTLLNDGFRKGGKLKRIYIISAFPEGEYKIRLKKGNSVVEKSFTKTTAANPIE